MTSLLFGVRGLISSDIFIRNGFLSCFNENCHDDQLIILLLTLHNDMEECHKQKRTIKQPRSQSLIPAKGRPYYIILYYIILYYIILYYIIYKSSCSLWITLPLLHMRCCTFLSCTCAVVLFDDPIIFLLLKCQRKFKTFQLQKVISMNLYSLNQG